jgi:hypothetical protein
MVLTSDRPGVQVLHAVSVAVLFVDSIAVAAWADGSYWRIPCEDTRRWSEVNRWIYGTSFEVNSAVLREIVARNF